MVEYADEVGGSVFCILEAEQWSRRDDKPAAVALAAALAQMRAASQQMNFRAPASRPPGPPAA